MELEDKLKIQEVIARFATSFDVKDWDGMQACFTEELFTDYSDLRGTPSQTISAADYIAARSKAQESLKMHHLVSNYETDFSDANTATCRAAMMVWRKSKTEDYTSHCVYTFQLKKLDADRKISATKQKVLWNDGTEIKS